MKRNPYLIVIALFIAAIPALGISLNQTDNFEDGTVQGWFEGGSSPNPPTNISTGGPAGANDNFLRNISSGSAGAGGKMVMFNQSQWSGDYVSAGVSRIEADMNNLGAGTLNVRIAFSSADSQWVSDPAFVLAASSGWKHAMFNLTDVSFAQVAGSETLSESLMNVSEVRILSSSFASYNGDTIAGTLGVDNITATSEPASMMLIGAGGLLTVRRRRA